MRADSIAGKDQAAEWTQPAMEIASEGSETPTMSIVGIHRQKQAARVDGLFDAACDVTIAARALKREGQRGSASMTSIPAGVGALEDALEALAAAADALERAAHREHDAQTRRSIRTLSAALMVARRRCAEARRTAALADAQSGSSSHGR